VSTDTGWWSHQPAPCGSSNANSCRAASRRIRAYIPLHGVFLLRNTPVALLGSTRLGTAGNCIFISFLFMMKHSWFGHNFSINRTEEKTVTDIAHQSNHNIIPKKSYSPSHFIPHVFSKISLKADMNPFKYLQICPKFILLFPTCRQVLN